VDMETKNSGQSRRASSNRPTTLETIGFHAPTPLLHSPESVLLLFATRNTTLRSAREQDRP
jgi:hypothetical protein